MTPPPSLPPGWASRRRLDVYPELLERQVERGPAMNKMMAGFEAEMDAQIAAKAKHDSVFAEVTCNRRRLFDLQ